LGRGCVGGGGLVGWLAGLLVLLARFFRSLATSTRWLLLLAGYCSLTLTPRYVATYTLSHTTNIIFTSPTADLVSTPITLRWE
jgi:hypothetical protein